jgi:hypothetical protein
MHVAKAGRIASHRRCLSGSMPAKLPRVVPALSTTGARRSGDHRPSWAIVGCRASSEALRIRLTQRSFGGDHARHHDANANVCAVRRAHALRRFHHDGCVRNLGGRGARGALLIFGRCSDAVGRRPVLLGGAILAFASAVVFLCADNLALLLVGRLLSGLSAGVFTGTATAAIVEAAAPAQQDRAATAATIANVAGLGSGPAVAGILVQYAPQPLQLSFVVHMVLVVIAICAILLAPETASRTGRLGFQRLSVPP